MDVSEALRSRRSIRDFKSEPVPAEVLRAILDDARWAPSWSNTQPYRVAVATGALRDRLCAELCARYDAGQAVQSASAPGKLAAVMRRDPGIPDGDFKVKMEYPEELQAARRATGFGLYSLLGIDRKDMSARTRQMRRNYEFFGAPVALFVFVHEGLGPYSVLDAGFFMQSLLLSAAARGLGTCAQGALAVWASPVRAAFQVPAHYKLIAGISVGYPSDHAVNTFNPGRAEVDSLLIPPASS